MILICVRIDLYREAKERRRTGKEAYFTIS